MARFEVRVLLLDIEQPNAWEARSTVEKRLRGAGFERWRVIGLRPQGALTPRRHRHRRPRGARGDEAPVEGGNHRCDFGLATGIERRRQIVPDPGEHGARAGPLRLLDAGDRRQRRSITSPIGRGRIERACAVDPGEGFRPTRKRLTPLTPLA